MRELPFEPWFQTLTGHPTPRRWQADLVAEPDCRNRLIRIPTGLGKTEGVLATWSYHRLHRQDDSWPRRLVWCLPMRGLVEPHNVSFPASPKAWAFLPVSPHHLSNIQSRGFTHAKPHDSLRHQKKYRTCPSPSLLQVFNPVF
jgi:hypothetical protein